MSNRLDPDQASGMLWVQSVCKGYQQTTLGGKELGWNIISRFKDEFSINLGIKLENYQHSDLICLVISGPF